MSPVVALDSLDAVSYISVNFTFMVRVLAQQYIRIVHNVAVPIELDRMESTP